MTMPHFTQHTSNTLYWQSAAENMVQLKPLTRRHLQDAIW